MSMQIVGFLALGLFAGVISGLTGIGGGVIVVPALVLLLGYSQGLAQGTTLALMVPPIGLLAAWSYYQKGLVDIRAAAIIAVAFVVGGYFGAQLALNLPQAVLRRIFAIMLGIVALRMFFDIPTKPPV